MLKKTLRLNTQEFKAVFKDNQQFHGDYFIKLMPSNNLLAEKPFLMDKFAVVVSKKTYKLRIDRNLIRRFVYRYLNDIVKQGNKVSGGILMLRKDKSDYLALIKERPIEARGKIDEIL